MTSISSSILTSRIFSVVYGSLYILFLIVITIHALIEFIKIYKKIQKHENSKNKNDIKDHIELQIVNNSKHQTRTIHTDKVEEKYDDELELKYEEKEEDLDIESNDNDLNAILEYIHDKNIDLDSVKGKIKFLIFSINNKRAMYLTILLHIFDTATDIGVILDWYTLSKIEENDEDNIEGIDMKGFFYLGVGILLFYR
eukprot:307543_1